MTTRDRALHGTYRCPVCGHRDSVEVLAGGSATRITCSYCRSELEVSARSEDDVNLSVQLAQATVHG